MRSIPVATDGVDAVSGNPRIWRCDMEMHLHFYHYCLFFSLLFSLRFGPFRNFASARLLDRLCGLTGLIDIASVANSCFLMSYESLVSILNFHRSFSFAAAIVSRPFEARRLQPCSKCTVLCCYSDLPCSLCNYGANRPKYTDPRGLAWPLAARYCH